MWGLLRTLAVLWLLKQAFRLLRALTVAAILVALWPVTITAAVAALAAWLRGWPPARLYRAAAGQNGAYHCLRVGELLHTAG